MAFYSDFAGSYEEIFPFRTEAAAFLDHWLLPSGRVLDVGCGTGRYCRHLDGTGRRCTGIDLDPGMIDEAQRLHAAGDFRLMGMEEIGLLGDGDFDGVFCIGNVLPHLPAPQLAGFLGAVRDLLRPGGDLDLPDRELRPPARALDGYAFPPIRPGDGELVFRRVLPGHPPGRAELRDRARTRRRGDLPRRDPALPPHQRRPGRGPPGGGLPPAGPRGRLVGAPLLSPAPGRQHLRL